MFVGLGAKAQFIDPLNHIAQVVAALDAVFDLAKDLADFVFDGVGAGGALLKARQVGEELAVDEVAQVIARERLVVVEVAVGGFGRGPSLPAVGWVEDVVVGFALKLCFGGFVGFERV